MAFLMQIGLDVQLPVAQRQDLAPISKEIAFLGVQKNNPLLPAQAPRQNTGQWPPLQLKTHVLISFSVILEYTLINLQATTIFCDNISALHLTCNPMFHAWTKHIEIEYHFVCEKVSLGSLITRFISSSNQATDILTKALSREKFLMLRSK